MCACVCVCVMTIFCKLIGLSLVLFLILLVDPIFFEHKINVFCNLTDLFRKIIEFKSQSSVYNKLVYQTYAWIITKDHAKLISRHFYINPRIICMIKQSIIYIKASQMQDIIICFRQ